MEGMGEGAGRLYGDFYMDMARVVPWQTGFFAVAGENCTSMSCTRRSVFELCSMSTLEKNSGDCVAKKN